MKNKVTLYFAEDNSAFDASTLSHFLTYLSKAEVVKCRAFHFEKDRRLYLISHAMVRLVLSEITGILPDNLIFYYNEFGKPSLKYFPDVSFNLSHSQSVAVLAVSNNGQFEIGVDVEYNQRDNNLIELIAHFFSPSECKLFRNKPKSEQNHLFFKLWTLKEAYIKATGRGLSFGLENFSFNIFNSGIDVTHHCKEENKIKWFFGQMLPFKNYFAAIAVRNCGVQVSQLELISYDWYPGRRYERKMLEVTSSTKFKQKSDD